MPPKAKPKKKLTERPSGNGKRLTLPEKIIIKAERETGKSYGKISEEYGVAKSTAKAICDNKKLNALVDKVEHAKKGLLSKFTLAVDAGLNRIEETIGEASISQAAMTTGIMFDKMRLLEEKSTQNVSHNVYLDLINSVPVDEKFDE